MRRFLCGILTGALALLLSADLRAQEAYKKGDVFLANVYFGGCVKVTVLGTDPKYYVHIEEGGYKGSDTFYNANRLGECKQGNQAAGPANPPAGQPEGNAGNLRVGSRVDVYYAPNQPHGRGVIVDANSSQYKVHFDGCEDKFDAWSDFARVRSEAAIGPDDADVQYLFGRWSMVVSGMSSVAVAWGKAPGLEVRGDGTYTWYQDKGREPVKGRWTTYPKLEGANKFSIDFEDGILIRDPEGRPWKVFRSSGAGGAETISVNRLCYGAIRQTGFRAK
jgi:hypothetical protein